MRKEIEQAKKLGAVKVANYYVKPKSYYGYSTLEETEVFSTHFFNSDGLEIAYYINSTVDFFGLTVFDKPRSWGTQILSKNNYSFSKL